MGKRGHHNWSKACLPIGTIRIRTRREGRRTHSVRFIKVRVGGSKSSQWIPLARRTWELAYGPVPAGMRVCHMDGNTLNDDPANYGLLTAGEIIKLYHRLDPVMSEENRRGGRRRELVADHNRLRGRILRATSFLPTRWYAVNVRDRVIHNRPFRSRRQLLAVFVPTERIGLNGGISRRRLSRLPIQPVRGRDLSSDVYQGFQKVEVDGTVYRPRPELRGVLYDGEDPDSTFIPGVGSSDCLHARANA